MKSERGVLIYWPLPSIQEHVLTDECKVDVARCALLEEGSPVLVVVAQVLSENVVHKLRESASHKFECIQKMQALLYRGYFHVGPVTELWFFL